MLSIILALVIALGFGYFATFNTTTLPLVFGHFYTTPALPLYVIIGLSLALGIVLSWVRNLVKSLHTSLKLHGKEVEIKKGKATIHEMTKKTNELQIENANLKGELHNDPLDDTSL